MKIYPAENIINCRDLGGYACPGGETAYGRVIRCGIPKDPTVNDLELLRSLGVKTVIDIRGYGETREMPSLFLNPELGFDYHNISLLEANPALTGTEYSMSHMYIGSLEEYGANYAGVLRLMISLEGPFVIHCFLGKDRTGLLAALLLLCAGVSREDALRDYERSYELIKPFIEREIAAKSGLIWDQDVSRLMSDRVNLEETLDFLDGKYGGVYGYLRHTGLDDEEIDAVKKLLLT